MNKQQVAVTLEPEHLAIVRAYAKDQGYPSTSAALRRIIDEWQRFKARELAVRPDASCEAEWDTLAQAAQG
ncbi:MAG: hypothetical protein ABT940_11175 [Alphaproteobacteria bacterium]